MDSIYLTFLIIIIVLSLFLFNKNEGFRGWGGWRGGWRRPMYYNRPIYNNIQYVPVYQDCDLAFDKYGNKYCK